MLKVNVMLDDGAYVPTRAHLFDAGLDIRTPVKVTVKARGSATVDTGVHVEIPKYYVGKLEPKSGLNIKHNIIGTGVIDSGFTGSIIVKLYNLGDEDYTFEAGDKIIQLIVSSCLICEPMIVTRFNDSERGDNGLGSTGR